jgi:hypothetical protein
MAGQRRENANTATLVVGNAVIDVPASLPDLGKLREQLEASLETVDEEIGRRRYAGDDTGVSGTPMQSAKGGEWSDEKNARRCELIDREIAGATTDDEQRELERLQLEVDEHVARSVPRPLAELEKIKQLLCQENAEGEESL